MRTKPKNLEEQKVFNLQTSGQLPRTRKAGEKEPKEIFLKEEEIVLLFNNQKHEANLAGIEDYLEEMWEIKQDIIWDREASKKKIINWVEQKPDPTDKTKKIEEFKGDYIYYIHNPDITNEIKKTWSLSNAKH